MQIAALIFYIAAQVAPAEPVEELWLVSLTGDAPARTAVFIDVASIATQAPGSVVAWSVTYEEKTQENDTQYTYVRHRFDCAARTFVNLRFEAYDYDGWPVVEFDLPEAGQAERVTPIPPGTAGDRVRAFACENDRNGHKLAANDDLGVVAESFFSKR